MCGDWGTPHHLQARRASGAHRPSGGPFARERKNTMLRKFTLPLALCALTVLCRPVLAADDDPKGVVTAFFKAMETGDVAGAKSLAVGSDKQLAVLDVLVPVFHSFKQL